MTATLWWPWATLLLLGAAHGINPGMGWLFAVALGLQEGGRRAVWAAIAPLALGHAAAIAVAAALAVTAGLILPLQVIEWGVALTLGVLGVRMLIRHRHRRWGGMRVGFRDLVLWSFLMASAHGAGLMAIPALLRATETSAVARPPVNATPGPAGLLASAPQGTRGAASASGPHAGHAMHAVPDANAGDARGRQVRLVAILATAVHSVGYLLVTALVAVVVFERVGLRFLRSAWVNLDALWAIALIVTGVAAVAL